MGSTIVEQDFPFDILHRGQRDVQRHNKRVQEATKRQLRDIISQQDIITSEGNKKVKVRLKYLDQYRFMHNRDYRETLGRDQFDELEEGEVLYEPSPSGSKGPAEAGDEDGELLYEVEFTLEELTEMMFEELALPDLDETKKNEIVADVLEYTDRRKKNGISACLDRRHTLLSIIKRRAKLKRLYGDKPIPISPDDLQFRTWNITQQKYSNAVIFLMMDRSGSMWQEKIYAVKALYFWIVQFLRRRYDKVEIRFIAHDYSAYELDEKEFFTIADGGGTKVSSAYNKCKEIIGTEYPSEVWNIYAFHASDGDSWNDEPECMEIVNDILDLGASMFAYTEINLDKRETSKLWDHFEKEKKSGLLISQLNDMGDLMDILSKFLKKSHRSPV